MNIFFTVEPTTSNSDSAEACKLLLMELLKKDNIKDSDSLLDSRNDNIKKHQSDEKVEISDLKNLISSLGTPLQTNGSGNTFPKPSCGKYSAKSDSDGEKSQKNILRKRSSRCWLLQKWHIIIIS